MYASVDNTFEPTDILIGAEYFSSVEPGAILTTSINLSTARLAEGCEYVVFCRVIATDDEDGTNNLKDVASALYVYSEDAASLSDVFFDKDEYFTKLGCSFQLLTSTNLIDDNPNLSHRYSFGDGPYRVGASSEWFSSESYGRELGEKEITCKIVDVEAKRVVAVGSVPLTVQRADLTLNAETEIYDDSFLVATLTVNSVYWGNPVCSWTIEWDDGITEEYENLGYTVTIARYFEGNASESLRSANITISDCAGEIYEFVFCAFDLNRSLTNDDFDFFTEAFVRELFEEERL